MTRYRMMLIWQRASEVNRVQKILEFSSHGSPGRAGALASGPRVSASRVPTPRRREEPHVDRHGERQTRERDDDLRRRHLRNPRSLSDDVTTETLESAIARDASMGWSVPCQPHSGPIAPPGRSHT